MSRWLCVAIPVLLVAVRVVQAILNLRRVAPLREKLRTFPHRWLIYFVPFSPAFSALMIRTGQKLISFPISMSFVDWGVFCSSIFTATAAAAWLGLLDPNKTARLGHVQGLAIIFWILDAIACGIIGY